LLNLETAEFAFYQALFAFYQALRVYQEWCLISVEAFHVFAHGAPDALKLV
jgi:hypothetical protein